MAPEVISQENPYSFKADIWSLGITAMELCNGEPPHSTIHPMKVLFLIPKEPAPRLEGNRWSRDFKDFVERCLVKDPNQRASARELLNHRFIKNAGRVEELQSLIERREAWQLKREARGVTKSHPRLYEETMFVAFGSQLNLQLLTLVLTGTPLEASPKRVGTLIQSAPTLTQALSESTTTGTPCEPAKLFQNVA